MKVNEIIGYHIDQSNRVALKEVERMARKILRERKHLHYFMMAMGSYFFVDYKGETVETLKSTYTKTYNYVTEDAFKYFKSLNDFISSWDDILKITGEGMTFTANGKVINDWTKNPHTLNK